MNDRLEGGFFAFLGIVAITSAYIFFRIFGDYLEIEIPSQLFDEFASTIGFFIPSSLSYIIFIPLVIISSILLFYGFVKILSLNKKRNMVILAGFFIIAMTVSSFLHVNNMRLNNNIQDIRNRCEDRYDDKECIISRIVAIDNPELCEEVEGYFDECYMIYAINTGNIEKCDMIVDEDFIEMCLG